MNKKAKQARFDAMGGREGIALRILEIANEIVSGSYKRAVAGAGQMKLLAELCEADTYWDEKMSYGYSTEERIANGAKKVTFNSNGHIDWRALEEAKNERH